MGCDHGGDNFYPDGRSAFFHGDGGDGYIQSPGFEQTIPEETVPLRVHVIDVGGNQGDTILSVAIILETAFSILGEDAQTIGPVGDFPGAQATADVVDGGERTGSESLDEVGQDGSPGGGDQFPGWVTRFGLDGDVVTANNFGNCGDGDGHQSVFATYRAIAQGWGCGGYCGHVQPPDGEGGGADVEYGIDGPHLVEVDMTGVDAVDTAFGLGQEGEDFLRVVFDWFGKLGLGDDRQDVREVSISCFLWDIEGDMGSDHSLSVLAGYGNLPIGQGQGRKGRDQLVPVQAEIQTASDKHIPGQAGNGIQMNVHGTDVTLCWA